MADCKSAPERLLAQLQSSPPKTPRIVRLGDRLLSDTAAYRLVIGGDGAIPSASIDARLYKSTGECLEGRIRVYVPGFDSSHSPIKSVGGTL